jgi:TonB family protein
MNAWLQAMFLWSWQSLLLVGLILVVVKIAHSQSAATKHSLWLIAIFAMALLPAANALIRILAVSTPPVAAPIAYVAQLPTITDEVLPAATQSAGLLSRLIVPMLFALWIGGVTISILGSFLSLRRWRHIAQAASQVEPLGLPVPVGYSTQVKTPVLVGTFRPMILLPADTETWMGADERRAVLLHELAHVERRDHWLHFIHPMMKALFFFHPAVRYALRQLSVERELACDERVLAAGISPSTYAEIILKVAERSIQTHHSDCPAFHSSGKTLERRIDMILSHQNSKAGSWHLPLLARIVLVTALAALLLPQRSIASEALALTPSEFQFATVQPFARLASALARESPRPAQPVQAATPPLQTGAVSGTVSDPSGAVVPGVMITLTGGGTVMNAVTNERGAFSLPQVVAGEYTLQTRLPGFSTSTRTITVRAGQPLTQNILLGIAPMNTTVLVAATKPTAPPAAPPVSSASTPLRVGGNITQPNLINPVKPVYPTGARNAGIQDVVQLTAVIGKDGSIVSLQLDTTRTGSNNPELIQAAMDAVRQWRYRPGTLNGQPVDVTTTITVNFTLE